MTWICLDLLVKQRSIGPLAVIEQRLHQSYYAPGTVVGAFCRRYQLTQKEKFSMDAGYVLTGGNSVVNDQSVQVSKRRREP